MTLVKSSSIDLMATFRQFQSEAKFTDLKISGQDSSQTFNCHKLVISAASKFFTGLLKDIDENEELTVIIPQMNPEILVRLANYIYGNSAQLSREMEDWLLTLGIPVCQEMDCSTKGDPISTAKADFPCPFKSCDLFFSTRDMIENHILTAHKAKEEIKCKHCGKKFLNHSKLNQHLLSHENRLFVCMAEGCEKSFKLKRYLIQHSKVHEEKRGLNCQLCNKLLAGPRELKAHLRVHTGEKPYFCKECGASFRNRSTCNTHMKVHSNQRNHVCPEPQCNHAFIQLGDLRKHMRSKHTNERPFSCDQCGKTFARSDYLLKHMRAHRKNDKHIDTDQEDVNALLSEAMLDDDVGLEALETTGTIELVLPTS